MRKTMVRTKTKTSLATSMYSNVVIHSVSVRTKQGRKSPLKAIFLYISLKPLALDKNANNFP